MKEQSPREKRHARTRQAILDAALQILVEHGIDSLSIREIAHQIEYSPSGLYEYFASKEEIVQALRHEGFRLLGEQLRQVPDHFSVPDKIVEAGINYLKFAQTHAQLYQLMFGRTPASRVSLQNMRKNSAYNALFYTIEQGIANGELTLPSPITAQTQAYGLWSLVHGMAMLRLTLLQDTVEDLNVLNRPLLEAAVRPLRSP